MKLQVKYSLFLGMVLCVFSQIQGMQQTRRTLFANPALRTRIFQPTLKRIGTHQSPKITRYQAPHQTWSKQTITRRALTATLGSTILYSIYHKTNSYFSSIHSTIFNHLFTNSIHLDPSTPTLCSFDYERDIDDLVNLFNEESDWLGRYTRANIEYFAKKFNIKILRTAHQVIGFVIYNNNWLKGYIDFIAINRKFQGKGFGKQLINAVLDDFEAKGIKTVYLRVYYNNYKARHVYEKMGFTPISESYYVLTYKKRLDDNGLDFYDLP